MLGGFSGIDRVISTMSGDVPKAPRSSFNGHRGERRHPAPVGNVINVFGLPRLRPVNRKRPALLALIAAFGITTGVGAEDINLPDMGSPADTVLSIKF